MQMFLKSSPYRDYGEGYSYMKIIVKVNVTILNIPYVCTYKTWLITQFYVFFDQRRPTLCMYICYKYMWTPVIYLCLKYYKRIILQILKKASKLVFKISSIDL